MKKKGLVLAGLMALCVLAMAGIPAYAQQDITVSIGNVSLPPQAYATLPIMITNETTQKVSSAEINLTYDPNVVQITGVEGNELFDIFTSNITDGTVSMVGTNWTFLTTPIKFADVTIKAVGNPGDYSPLNFTTVKLSDEMGGWIEPTRSNGSVSITAVAVPAFNIYGLSVLIGLLAIIMGISIMAKVKRR